MDVKILTKHNAFYGITSKVLIAISVASLILSCGTDPPEGEIVIRAEDIALRDSLAGVDSFPFLPSETDTIPADSMEIPILPVPDTLPEDSISVIEPDSAECPWERMALEINGSIYASLAGRIDDPDILGAHIVRCMWWNTDPWRGMNAGDSLYVLIGETGRENQVVALRYVSREGTPDKSFSVYSYTMTGDNYPSHYYSDGTEVMKQLNFMPITTFEEMTGPYGEPRGSHRHSGVDYKAPEGTPVRTCTGGVVARLNWNHDYNGNCVEVAAGSGYSEVFLHLHGIANGLYEGMVLEKGDVVGYVGNTGVTSTASHIHYQINDENGNSIDPYLFFSSHRRSLSAEDMVDFRVFRDNCDRWLRTAPG